LYLAGSLTAFRSGGMQLFQVAFARAGNNQIPWTRQYLYEPPAYKQQYNPEGGSHAKL